MKAISVNSQTILLVLSPGFGVATTVASWKKQFGGSL